MDSSSPVVIEQIDDDSNYILGLIGSGIAMLVGAIIWGAITYFTQYYIRYLSIGLGFLVGFAFRFFGKGHNMIFGFSSAALTLIGCILGNLSLFIVSVTYEKNRSFIEVLFVLITNPILLVEFFMKFFDVRDLFFYGIVAYIGFRAALDNTPSKK